MYPLKSSFGFRQITAIFLSFFLFIFFKHGEPGAAVADLQPVDTVVSHVLKQILSPVSVGQLLFQIACVILLLIKHLKDLERFPSH